MKMEHHFLPMISFLIQHFKYQNIETISCGFSLHILVIGFLILQVCAIY